LRQAQQVMFGIVMSNIHYFFLLTLQGQGFIGFIEFLELKAYFAVFLYFIR
jgi:hypothetical protein